jgi:hypothetical protein
MMGINGRAFGPLPPVTLEDLVPPDHFSRHLERTLDLGFVRDLVRDAYASSGRAEAATCNACPVKARCTTSDRGRIVHRSLYEAYLDTVRTYRVTEAYKKAIRKRQVWVEPLFAEAKSWHGLRRLRLRGLLNANIQGLLIATGQNLKRFLAATGWGRRHAPSGSLLALPMGVQGLSAVSG